MYRALALLCLVSTLAHAEIRLEDENRTQVYLKAPAQRIVSLAPHITELLYAAGAGGKIVGAVDYSDYPPQAAALPNLGSYARLDIERIAALKPDLALAWRSGNAPAALDQLRRLGIPVFVLEAKQIDDVARDLERIGQLAATENSANAAARQFRQRHATLRQQFEKRRPVSVFYQVWSAPLMTVGGEQIISAVIQLCGGTNIFAQLPTLAPTISVEAVLEANPEVIIAGGMGTPSPGWLDNWRKWPKLRAVAADNLFFIDPNLLQRHTPRLLDGAAQVCGKLEDARSKP